MKYAFMAVGVGIAVFVAFIRNERPHVKYEGAPTVLASTAVPHIPAEGVTLHVKQ